MGYKPYNTNHTTDVLVEVDQQSKENSLFLVLSCGSRWMTGCDWPWQFEVPTFSAANFKNGYDNST